MTYLLKAATIIDKHSSWNGKKVDILIRRGKIEAIGRSIKDEKAKVIESKHLCVSPGWMDIGTTLTDPGHEDLDDIRSLCDSAATGGFTALAVMPNTDPVVDNKGIIHSLRLKSADEIVDIFPIGALTVDNNGKDISEMSDMLEAGAIAFSDGTKSVQHAGVIQRALRYTANMDTVIVNRPNDATLSESGIMNESKESAFLGLKGIPSLAEEIMVHRDIQLCEYTESTLLSHMISTRESVRLIKKAKQKELNVSASVSFHNLVETDQVLKDFDPMHKVLPPLRTRLDANALVRALQDDVIDCIVSNHTPQDVEEKKKAFLYAGYGSLGLEQLFAVVHSRLSGKLELEVLVDKLCNGPREVMRLPLHTIEKGAEANLTFFDPKIDWTFDKNAIRSKCSNAAFLNEELRGKVIGILANSKVHLNK